MADPGLLFYDRERSVGFGKKVEGRGQTGFVRQIVGNGVYVAVRRRPDHA